MELYKHKPTFYSLGNFIFDQRYGPTTEAILVKINIVGKKISKTEIAPVFIKECVPEEADEKTAARIKANFLKYSEPFGLQLLQDFILLYRRDRIDLVNLGKASPLLMFETATHGKVLYEENGSFLRFKLKASARYADTEHLRRMRQSYLDKELS